MKLNFYGKSDTGLVRSANQDNFRIMRLCEDSALFVVCDGMGGARGGNVASELAAEAFCEKLRKLVTPKINQGVLRLSSDTACRMLDDAVEAANLAVYKKSQSSKEFGGMGTTLVAALFCGDVVYAVNVGDSRLYIISGGAITQITHDHSYVQHLIDIGSLTPEEARVHPYRNRITRAVGIAPAVEADIFSIELASLEQCLLLLCSDGLYGMLPPEELRDLICAAELDEPAVELETEVELKVELDKAFEPLIAPDHDSHGRQARDSTDDKLEALVNTLVDAANDAGGIDNITAVVVKYTEQE